MALFPEVVWQPWVKWPHSWEKDITSFLIFLHVRAGVSTCKSYSCPGQRWFPMTASLNADSCSDWYHKVGSCRYTRGLERESFSHLTFEECLEYNPWTWLMPSVFASVYWNGEGGDPEDERYEWGRSNVNSWKPTEAIQEPPHLQYVQKPQLHLASVPKE